VPGRSYALGQVAKTALFATDNEGAVSKKSLAIFSNRIRNLMSGYESELGALRQRVDAIDVQLLALLNARAAVVSDIYALKERHGTPRFNRTRTDAILERLVSENRGPLSAGEVRALFAPLLSFFVERFRAGGDGSR
jgi:chorismate mutase